MRGVIVGAVLLGACSGSVSGSHDALDGGGEGEDEVACCFALRCAPGQECFDCSCRDSNCCAELMCVEELQVCVGCACITPDGNQVGDCNEDTCPGGTCCPDGCRECCEDADCDDDEGCTADRCVDGLCEHEAPLPCTDCCEALCERVQPLDCTDIFRGDCTDSCAALSGVQDQAGCTEERVAFEACVAVCEDPCESGACDDTGDTLGQCLLDYCLDHLDDGDCQTLAAAFGL